jgi:AraC-like DNA-binding protein
MSFGKRPASRVAQPEAAPAGLFSAQVTSASRFFLGPPRAGVELAVVSAGREACAADYRVERATFPFLCIEFVASGRGTLALDGKLAALSGGSIFAYGPSTKHEIASVGEPLRKYFVDFGGRRGRALLTTAGLTAGSVGRVRTPNRIGSLLDELIATGSEPARHVEERCRALLWAFAYAIADARVPDTPAAARALQAESTYERCRQVIESRALELRSSADAARACHVAPAYLCRLFQRYDSVRPYDYLLKLKMNRAVELLQAGKLVKEVAAEVGMADPYHFSRVFKRLHGLSPSSVAAWRRG